MPTPPQHTFPKAEKLKSRKQIDLLFQCGKSFFAAPVKCYYRVEGLKDIQVDELTSLQVEELVGVKSKTANVKSDASAYPQRQNPEPETLSAGQAGSNPKPETLSAGQAGSNPKPETLSAGQAGSNPEPETLSAGQAGSNPKPETLSAGQAGSNPEPETLSAGQAGSNLKPQTKNHKQQTINIKAGVSVSKKNFKHSVDRNRIKRLLREAYRLHKHTLMEKLADKQVTLEVFFVFTDRSLPTFSLVEEKMKYCLRRLGKIAEGGS
jgi:ribonuclease P protein component